jgi:hypothetical protein
MRSVILALACFLFAAAFCVEAADSVPRDPIVDDAHSPHATLHSVPVSAVRMGPGFWEARRKINVERSLPTMLDLETQNGWLDNFLRLEGKTAPRKGPVYTDSDIYKWMEAVAWTLASTPQPYPPQLTKLQGDFERLTQIIGKAQEPSGYLDTYYQDEQKSKRFQEMYRSHELYCLGHLLQAAIAHYRTTGDRKLLDIGIRYADYLVATFGPDRQPALTGHPELEMALVELYRTTGQKKYLDFAGYLFSGVETQRLHLTPAQTKYMFSGIPFTSRTLFEGHAVRAMYASTGATDYYMETGDENYRRTLDRLWSDLIASKLYITGGVGSRAQGEAFGEPYELPDAQAYTESCAAIATLMWNWRMALAFGESKYVDVMERALYNGINSGMSLNGTLYCYRNPLESNGEKIRNEWYDTDCCPPNLERTFAELPGYLYATSPDGLYVNFFHNSTFREDAGGIRLTQTTDYPWSGEVKIRIEQTPAREWSLHVRIPAWSKDTAVRLNGNSVAAEPGRFLAIRRTWRAGDQVTLTFDMKPRLTASNPLVRENAERVAVERGPLVYCLEQPDNAAVRLFDAEITPALPFGEERRPDMLGGIVVLKQEGVESASPLSAKPLYQSLPETEFATRPVELTLIPYYAWANRGPDQMEVWISLAKK